MYVDVLILLVAAWLLIKATGLVINNLNMLSNEAKMAKFGLAAVVVAASTSFPELFVGIGSALEGVPNLSLGNVVGSNLANVSLVIGLAAVVSGGVAIKGEYMRRELAYAFMVGGVPLVLLSDGRLNRIEGLGMIVGYIIYVRLVLGSKRKEVLKEETKKIQGRFWEHFGWKGIDEIKRTLSRLFFGMAIILISAEVVVRTSMKLAMDLDLPILMVGLFVVAIGTSLPELSLWIREAIAKEGAFVFGNLMGSIMTNSLLVAGTTVLIRPLEIVAIESYLIAAIAYIVVFGCFWIFTSSKKKLGRREGLALVGLYLIFLVVEFSKENGYMAEIQHLNEWFKNWL